MHPYRSRTSYFRFSASVSDELVRIAGGPNLHIVTGLQGYLGKWSTYLQVISKSLTSHLKTEGNVTTVS